MNFVEFSDVTCDFGGLLDVQRLVVAQEGSGAGDIGFRLFIRAAMNRIVRTLKEQRFTIHNELDARIAIFGVEAAQALTRQHDRRGNIVFYLHFVGGMKIGP